MTTPPRDLTAERAAQQYTMNDLFKLAMEGKVNIVEDRFVSAAALKTARQEAMREAAREVRTQKADDKVADDLNQALSFDTYNMTLESIAVALDRLASEGAPAPIDLLPKLKDDGGYGEHF